MFAWLTRRRAQDPKAVTRVEARLVRLENLVDDLESRLEYIAAELKKVRGRQFALEKHAQDDPGRENAEQPDTDEGAPKHPAVPSSAHLARRFRGW